MTDYFSLLRQPRRPWLDESAVKQEFLAQSGLTHPDRTHNAEADARKSAQEAYLALNAAYQCLRNPRQRLRHFLELESAAKVQDIQSVPDGLVTLFMEISLLCREADKILTESDETQSPLLKVAAMERNQDLFDKLEAMQRRLGDWRKNLEDSIKRLDTQWLSRHDQGPAAKAALLEDLGGVHNKMGYAERWFGQIQERMLKFSFQSL